jgi:prevent-host-death family protein
MALALRTTEINLLRGRFRAALLKVHQSGSIKLSAYLVREAVMLDISQDIHSLSDFKRNTSQYLQRMRGSGHPLVLTINGKAEVVVQDAASYQKLLNRVDELEALEGIKRGLADVQAGRVTPLRKFETEFRAKRSLPSRPR